MKNKFVRDISASTLQVVINQIAGIVIFYITSRFLDKNSFGELNWSAAVLATLFSILGSGIDQIVVHKVASKKNTESLLKIYLVHVFLTGSAFFIGLLITRIISPSFYNIHSLLILLSISQLLNFFSLPFKQIATGEEKFKLLFYMSTCANIIKSLGLILLMQFENVQILHVIFLYIFSTAVELTVCFLFRKNLASGTLSGKWNKFHYYDLIKESFPQLGSVIFNSAVARFDWILLGLLSSSIAIAEYSFAYKVFELCTLPLLILAPLLLPRLTRYFSITEEIPEGKIKDLYTLIRVEMIIASLIIMLLNVAWMPFIDWITHGKYGAVNIVNILILSACIPFLFLNNFMWTINFAQGKLKSIFTIIGITFLINILGDLLLIPYYSGRGAALAYFVAIVTQTIIYLSKTRIDSMSLRKASYPLIYCMTIALVSGLTSRFFFHEVFIQMIFSVVLFLILLLSTKQVRPSDMTIFKRILGIGI
jgi:O-antigen/teichoic acid export membrane protein